MIREINSDDVGSIQCASSIRQRTGFRSEMSPTRRNEQLQCLLFQLFRRQSQRLIAVTRRDGQQGRKNGCCPFEVSSTGKQQRFQLSEPFGGGVVVSYARESRS